VEGEGAQAAHICYQKNPKRGKKKEKQRDKKPKKQNITPKDKAKDKIPRDVLLTC
jgi:hypothetical protein